MESNGMSNTVSLKFVLRDGSSEPEVRRFTVDRRIGTSLASLQKLLATVFPNVGFKPFKLTWTDNDGDFVSVCSDNELATAMIEMKGPVYKFYVEILPEKKMDESSDQLHPGVTCDACKRPVVGVRYKCVTCPDFDLCKSCEDRGAHLSHNMVRIAAPKKICPQMFPRSGSGNISFGPRYDGTIRSGPGSISFGPRSDVMVWPRQEPPAPKQSSPNLKPKCAYHNYHQETPLSSLFKNLLSENQTMKSEAQKDAQQEGSRGEETRKEGSAKPEDSNVIVIQTPLGKMFYWVGNKPDEDKCKEGKNESASVDSQKKKEREEKQDESSPKSSTPEPEKPKECQRHSTNLKSMFDDFQKPNGQDFQLIDTPFGKMLYWVGACPEEEDKANKGNEDEKKDEQKDDQKEEKKETKTYQIKINVLPPSGNQANNDEPPQQVKTPANENDEGDQTNKNLTEPATSNDQNVETTEQQEIETNSNNKKTENETVVEQKSPTGDLRVREALQAMLDMGFTDDGGWLTKLLESKQGNVGSGLDVLQPAFVAFN